MKKIVDIVLALLAAIPILDRWFTRTPIEKEKEKRADVDQEHEKNKESGRPSNDFWQDRGV